MLHCGDCGHKYWGDPKKKGRIAGRAPVVTNYYTCAGRRSHGKLICPTPAHVRAEQLEGWVLGTLDRLVMGDTGATSYALDRIVATLMGEDRSKGEVERIEAELDKVSETVAALTASIDPANMTLLNERLTQLRIRKEHLEQELAAAKLAAHGQDEGEIRRWAQRQLAGLADALDGQRDDETRRVLASYVDRITLWPSKKRGEMTLADDLWPFLSPEKQHDRPPKRRSRGNRLAGAGFEPATSGLWARRATRLLYPAIHIICLRTCGGVHCASHKLSIPHPKTARKGIFEKTTDVPGSSSRGPRSDPADTCMPASS